MRGGAVPPLPPPRQPDRDTFLNYAKLFILFTLESIKIYFRCLFFHPVPSFLSFSFSFPFSSFNLFFLFLFVFVCVFFVFSFSVSALFSLCFVIRMNNQWLDVEGEFRLFAIFKTNVEFLLHFRSFVDFFFHLSFLSPRLSYCFSGIWLSFFLSFLPFPFFLQILIFQS